MLSFDCDNVDSSDLRFLQAISDPQCEAGDHRGLAEVFGSMDDAAKVQVAGNVRLRDGRCVDFPNTPQSCLPPSLWSISPVEATAGFFTSHWWIRHFA